MNGPSRPIRLFTVEEVNGLLPQLQALIEQLQALQRSIIETNGRLDELVRKLGAGNGYPITSIREEVRTLTQHQLQLIEAFHSACNQVEELGGVLKDIQAGLVDFYSLRAGERVFLCWKLSEAAVRFWHPLNEGYAGRRPLE